MKRTEFIICIALAVMLLNPASVMAGEFEAAVTVSRTRAWDNIEGTLGGVPESVRKIEYAGSVFYLADDVTDVDFLAVLAAGPEAVRMKAEKDSGKLYRYTVYILWNSDKTALLVHPIIYDYDLVLDAVAVPADTPASLTTGEGAPQTTVSAALLQFSEADIKFAPIKGMTKVETVEYMLSKEYANAVRAEFYRLLNEHRAANGLRELEINLELQSYADVRASEQRSRSGHTRPGGGAAGSGWRDSRNNMNTRYAENALATGAFHPDPLNTASGIFSVWKESEGHNRHMLYDFKPEIMMALGIYPEFDETGFVTSGAIFATGY